jgi:hypothetical protein
MRVFVSYASEQRDLAKRLTLGLEDAGHDVFFDRDDLPAGETYDDRIRAALLRADLFVFLVTRDALRPGAYSLTELALAESRWPHPAGRVLPVMADDTPIEHVPAYLRAVSILVPRGDCVAETLDAVARLARERRVAMRRRLLVAAGVVAAAAATWLLLVRTTPRVADDELGPDGALNSHVFGLKGGGRVRMVGTLLANESPVDAALVRREIEWMAWRYNRCYDAAFGGGDDALPAGTVVVEFEIEDQLPRRERLVRSDFSDAAFNDCVVGTLGAQTINRAGADATGRVVYAFEFRAE